MSIEYNTRKSEYDTHIIVNNYQKDRILAIFYTIFNVYDVLNFIFKIDQPTYK